MNGDFFSVCAVLLWLFSIALAWGLLIVMVSPEGEREKIFGWPEIIFFLKGVDALLCNKT